MRVERRVRVGVGIWKKQPNLPLRLGLPKNKNRTKYKKSVQRAEHTVVEGHGTINPHRVCMLRSILGIRTPLHTAAVGKERHSRASLLAGSKRKENSKISETGSTRCLNSRCVLEAGERRHGIVMGLENELQSRGELRIHPTERREATGAKRGREGQNEKRERGRKIARKHVRKVREGVS